MTPAGLEPAIPGSVGRCLIHWATGPIDKTFRVRTFKLWRQTNRCPTPLLPAKSLRPRAMARATRPCALLRGRTPANAPRAAMPPLSSARRPPEGARFLTPRDQSCVQVRGLYSSVAERQSCKLKVLGSIPSGGWKLCKGTRLGRALPRETLKALPREPLPLKESAPEQHP